MPPTRGVLKMLLPVSCRALHCCLSDRAIVSAPSPWYCAVRFASLLPPISPYNTASFGGFFLANAGLSYTACPRVLDAVNVALDALGVTADTSDYRDGYERAGYGERVYSDPYGEFAIDGASEASKSIFSNIYVIIGIAAGSCVLVSVICASIFCCRSDRDRQLVEVNPWGDADNDRIVISGGKSKKKKKGSAASPIIDDQPRLSTGIRGPPEAGILFAVESIKEKHAGQTVKKDLRSTTQTSSTLRKGYWVTIRHATTEGDHIVEVRTATKAESFLSQIPCPCCGGSDDASAPNAGPGIHSSISVDGFTTWVREVQLPLPSKNANYTSGVQFMLTCTTPNDIIH